MFNQILPTSNIRNIWRTVRRICMLILRLKGLVFFDTILHFCLDSYSTGRPSPCSKKARNLKLTNIDTGTEWEHDWYLVTQRLLNIWMLYIERRVRYHKLGTLNKAEFQWCPEFTIFYNCPYSVLQLFKFLIVAM